jgi:formate C-acetyltransferase
MNERIKRLRKKSIEAINTLSAERAQLVTRFYQTPETRKMSVPVQRAMCFDYILRNKKLCILDDELIVGERGPAPKATPTYPEVNVHSLKDLEILHNREKVNFLSDEVTRKAFTEEIIPFWKGMTNRDRMMELLPEEWHKAYSAGIFTEFMEQRAPGHTVLGDKIYNKGMLDLIHDIDGAMAKIDFFTDADACEKLEELKAMKIAAQAIIHFASRHVELLESLANSETNPERKQELVQMAEICRRIPAQAPSTFHEALQYYWFVHLGVITELNPWDSFNPGRLDQHLYPFYKKELKEGTLTREKAEELLHAFWIKFNNHPAPPKVGVTAQESNTYTDFSLINTGGVKADGSDGVNDLSYLILDVIEEMRLLQPSSMVQISKKTPDRFVHRALNIVKTGFGQPSIFNTDAILQELLRQGKSIEDARHGGASGCVETGAFGTECYILTGYFNLPKILEITLNRGIDPRSGEKIGIDTGDPADFGTFDELVSAYEKQVKHFADIKIKGSNIIEKLFATRLPAPFLSLLIDDCIANGRDYNAGGARYNTNYIQCVGMGTITDCLTSIRLHVFDKKDISMENMKSALKADFNGYDQLRWSLVYDTPKYGNDEEYADEQLVRVFEIVYDSINGRPSPRGATYRINLLPTTCHVYFGSKTGALPDGRKAGEPVSEGVSPVQGADKKGPTSVIRSVARIDHLRTGGTLLNQKFTPSFFRNEESIARLGQLIRSYFRLDGHHIQFNVVSAETLKDAQKNPEKYRDLIVRVAGYSDYFNDLGEDLQNEIIRRTEHETL